MKKVISLCAGAILFIVVLLFAVWLNFAPIIAYPIQELQYIKISYFDERNALHREIVVDDVTEKELLYQMLKRAKLVHVDRWAGDECGSDSGWHLRLYFNDAVEGYDSDVYSLEYGCRKYIRNKKTGQLEGTLIISSEELFEEVKKIIANEQS